MASSSRFHCAFFVALLLGSIALMAVPPVSATFHDRNFTLEDLPTIPQVAYNNVAWHPDGDYALIVGGSPGPQEAPERGWSVVMRWNGSEMDVVLAEQGALLFQVDFHPNGTYALIVGHTNTVLRYSEDEPGNWTIRNVWKESPLFKDYDLNFLGRGVSFKPNGEYALVSGGFLLRYDDERGFRVVHDGERAIFKNIAFAPNGTFAFIDGSAGERQPDGSYKIVLGSVFKYSDHEAFCADYERSTPCMVWVHNYGWHSPKFADVNAIAFAPDGRSAMIAGHDGGHGSILRWRWLGHYNDTRADEIAFQYFAQYHEKGRWSSIAWQPGGHRALMGAHIENQLYETDGGTFTKIIDNNYCRKRWDTGCPNIQDIAWHPSGTNALIATRESAVFLFAPDLKPWLIVRAPSGNFTVTEEIHVVVDAYVKRPGAKIERVEGWIEGRHVVVGHRESDRHPRWIIGRVMPEAFEPGKYNLTVRAFDGQFWTDNVTLPFYVANTAIPFLSAPEFLKSRYTEPTGTFKLEWSAIANATVYEWQESRDPLFRNARSHHTEDTAVEFFSQPPGMYHYRVRAHGAKEPSDWSASAYVNVSALRDEEIPVSLPTPRITSNDTLSLTGTFTVTWTPIPEASVYELQVASNRAFTEDVRALATREPTWDEQDREDGNYFYRVRARTNVEKSDWSNVYHVTVGEAQRTPPERTEVAVTPPPQRTSDAEQTPAPTPLSALVALAAIGAAACVRRAWPRQP